MLLLAGCGEVPQAGSSSTKKKSKKPLPKSPPMVKMPEVSADAYASVDAAMAEVESLSTVSGAEVSQKLLRIEQWFMLQGDSIAPQLASKINNPSVGIATRLTSCRVLAKTKSPLAIPTLIEATGNKDSRQLRLKAIESLGRCKPSSTEAVSKLLSLVDEKENDVRRVAINGLASVGPSAKRAVPKLMDILNDPKEDETIRSAAKAALRSVDPRKGLM
ncbi:MAG: HEAT repeat domain-containing protein [Pirellulaceae bacterium]|nr:HEAT repeat domain-containing protein [Pirellulaceae bacterium]